VPTKRERDLGLVRAAQGGSSDALDKLLGYYRPMAFRRAVVALGCPQAADDIAQHVMVSVFLKLDTFRQESAFSTWFYTITTNAIRMYIRSDKRARLLLSGDGCLPTETLSTQDYDSPDAIFDYEEGRGLVYDAIRALPEIYQEVITLWASGLSLLEIQEEVGESRSTVKTRIYRARLKMKDYIRDR